MSTDLAHGSKEALSIEESGHPESVWSPVEAPVTELIVAFDQLSEPEAQCARVPRDLWAEMVTHFSPNHF